MWLQCREGAFTVLERLGLRIQLFHTVCGSEAMETVLSDQGLQSTVAKAERKATRSTFDVGSKEGGGGRQVQESCEGGRKPG